MCSLIGLLGILLFGFFGLFGISSTVVGPGPAPTIVAIPVEMTPTPTPFVPTLVPTPASTEAPSQASAQSVPVPTDVAVLSCEPPPAGVDRMVVDDYRSDVLTVENGWSYTPSDGNLKTVGTWISDDLGAVAYAELLHYDCGLPPKVVDDYFNPDTWGTLFQNYASYRLAANCVRGDLRLFVFESVFEGRDYETRYWFEPIEDRRLMMFMLTTPVSEAATASELIEALYPDLPNCRGGVG
ncbi:MAG: hypothetical protein IPK19_01660 [Chloroflexi bacterium]|nr:hypothetical protein [Chloroflexota bacterium]